MTLKDLLNLKNGSIVSIVGAGGKTTLMFSLAEELRREYKVLVTTTTKIYYPLRKQYDFIAIGEEKFYSYNYKRNNGIYIYGAMVDNEKIIGLNPNILNNQVEFFDYVLIEADGSKRKILKGWRDGEPVVIGKTNKTIGVVNIKSIGKRICNENVHRVQEFINITNSHEGDIVNIEHIASLVFHKRGLFKDAVGEKILFLTMIEKEDLFAAKKLIELIHKKNNGFIDKIVTWQSTETKAKF